MAEVPAKSWRKDRIGSVPACNATHTIFVFTRSVTHAPPKTGVKIADRPKKRVITRLELTLIIPFFYLHFILVVYDCCTYLC